MFHDPILADPILAEDILLVGGGVGYQISISNAHVVAAGVTWRPL